MTKGKKLTAKQQAFVDEYLKDLNATQACIRAGYSAKTADRIGPELLGKTWVAAAIQLGMEKRQKRTGITQDMVLNRWWDIANADPNELVQYRRDCCRHCYGVDHRYQWIDQDEFNAAVDTAKLTELSNGRRARHLRWSAHTRAKKEVENIHSMK